MHDDDLKTRDQYCAAAKLHAWLSRVMQPALALLLLFSLAAEGQTGLGPNLGPNERPSRVIPPALATLLLLFSLAAEGQTGLGPNERLSGPALVGSVSIVQVVNTPDANFVFAGPCKGNIDASFSIILPFTVANATAENVEGLRFPGKGPARCLSQAGGEDLMVVTATRFTNFGAISAELVILYVVPQ